MKNNNFYKFGSYAISAALLFLLGWYGYTYGSQLVGYPSAPRAFAATEQREKPIRGNRNSKIYHWRGCPNYDDIKESNRVEFASADEAEQAGFRPAKNCRNSPPAE
jgi:hypothetical protein